MQETTYPNPFRVTDVRFLSWSPVEEPRRSQLLTELLNLVADDIGLTGCTISILETPLSFYEDLTLVAYSISNRAQDLFFLCPGDQSEPFRHLTGVNEPIFAANEAHGMVLTPETVLDYCRFFFHFVQGALGSFHIVESVDEIPWLPATADDIKAEADALIFHLTHRGLDHNGFYVSTASVIFRNALFKTDIIVAGRALEDVTLDPERGAEKYAIGQLALVNEEMLLDDMPIRARE